MAGVAECCSHLVPSLFSSNSNSDIWRNYSPLMKKLYRIFYLTSKQGSTTSVAASIMNFENTNSSSDVIYLQPYLLPSLKFLRRRNFAKKPRPPYPMFEMLGPYHGYVRTQPRLPRSPSSSGEDGNGNDDEAKQACQSLFTVCEELTGCKYPPSI